MRFLSADELSSIMGFPEGYFKRKGLKLSNKAVIKMIGNAVPKNLARAVIEPIANELFLKTA